MTPRAGGFAPAKGKVFAVLGFAALATAGILVASAPAQAFTLSDSYVGGKNGSTFGDVIGSSSTFGITSADITRPNYNTLKVVIRTAYAGVPGSSAALGTDYGSLFFSPVWTPTGTGPAYVNDVYQKNDWTYAFVTTNSTSGGLYSTGTVTNTNWYNSSSVASYTTTTGKIMMSNVYGDYDSGSGGSNNYNFREGQAVQFKPSNYNNVATYNGHSITGTWSVSASQDTITYIINDYHLLGDAFAMAWAMTCANDVIQGYVPVPGPIVGAGLPGILIAFVGLLQWRRMRRRNKLALGSSN